MKKEINFESIAKQYKCAVAAKYRPLKPEEISLIPSGKFFVSKKIDGELWLAHIDNDGAILFAKGGRFIKEGKQVALINFGARLQECLIAEKNLSKKGVDKSLLLTKFRFTSSKIQNRFKIDIKFQSFYKKAVKCRK